MLYIIVAADEGQTYGVFNTRQQAEAEIKQLYASGFTGPLRITEDELKED
jgi:hypothetical protein